MDAFKDRLSQRARDTSRPALAHQSRGRALSETEQVLADTLMTVMAGGGNFDAVAAALTEKGVRAPASGRGDWDRALLEAELTALNADLDAAYAEHGYGA